MELYKWGNKWGISVEALLDLQRRMGVLPDWNARKQNKAEGVVQTDVRLEAAEKDSILWRNNVGAARDQNGNFFRYGLCNDSAAVNLTHKSCDLIGIKKIQIEQHMVGTTFGQFLVREVKPGTWKYSATQREKAQLRFMELVLSFGGNAAFATGRGTL